jgi:hypothetical protein
MTSIEPSGREEIEALEARLSQAEHQLRRLKMLLKICAVVLGILLLCLLIPALAAIVGLTLFSILVLAGLFAYMYGVAWVAERLLGSRPMVSDEREGEPHGQN